MNTTELICKKCKAPLEYDEDGPSLYCPHCGYRELIDEPDEVKKERIRAKLFKDVELGKKEIEKEATVEEQRLKIEEQNIAVKKTRYIIIVIILAIVAVACIFLGYKIKHRNEVQVPLAAVSYCQREYEDAINLLKDAGFGQVESIEIADLSKEELSYNDKVSQVSINGNTTFEAKTWFDKDSTVKITYHVLDPVHKGDLAIPNSYDYYIDEEDNPKIYKTVNEFKNANFSNIILCPIIDINILQSSKNGTIQRILINNDSDFRKGHYVPADSEIKIYYRTSKLKYVGENYKVIESELNALGFNQIEMEELKDLSISEEKKEGNVSSILIGNTELDKCGELSIQDYVIIKYHSQKVAMEGDVEMIKSSKDFDGMDYQTAIKNLQKMGFINVIAVPHNNIVKKVLKKEGVVDTVSINGFEKYSVGDVFPKDAKVVVTYQSSQAE